ncbi:MAG: hypothetical protein ACKON8_10080 [Planctomycetota bacterium]
MDLASTDDTVATLVGTFHPRETHAVAELTKHQQSIVKNYYANLDTALLQRLGEQVTDLYLAEGKKREKLWTSIAGSLAKLGVPQSRIDTVRKSDDARRLATLVQELLAKD